MGARVESIDFQSGGRNQHNGRILYRLAGCLTQQFPELTVNMKIGLADQNLSAAGDGLAQMGIATPA